MIPLREIQEKLAFLRQHGAEAAAPDLKSTEKDLYALHPVMSAAAVLTFEAKLGLRLPEDFRTFITQVGNGGVGPFSGLSDRSLNTIGWYVKSLMPFQWDDLVQVKKLSLAEFNSEIKSELVSHLRSFERYLKSQSRYRELMKSYYDIQLAEDEYIAYGPLHGCLPIYHYPGGGMAYLVVAGPELGRVLRGPGHAGEKGGGRYELKGQFPAFYLEWLDNSIRKILFRE
ncbi:MAG: SMI1/KNR4 family protein, partial [Saprospiraceae bacterium]